MMNKLKTILNDLKEEIIHVLGVTDSACISFFNAIFSSHTCKFILYWDRLTTVAVTSETIEFVSKKAEVFRRSYI